MKRPPPRPPYVLHDITDDMVNLAARDRAITKKEARSYLTLQPAARPFYAAMVKIEARLSDVLGDNRFEIRLYKLVSLVILIAEDAIDWFVSEHFDDLKNELIRENPSLRDVEIDSWEREYGHCRY